VDIPDNRMATPAVRRGRPPNSVVAAREVPTEIIPIPEAAKLPHIQPMTCPQCGRGMTPKIRSTKGGSRYVTCALCARMMKITYQADGKQIITKL
jgi:hypothetical protein